jgi:hypothetical protein
MEFCALANRTPRSGFLLHGQPTLSQRRGYMHQTPPVRQTFQFYRLTLQRYGKLPINGQKKEKRRNDPALYFACGLPTVAVLPAHFGAGRFACTQANRNTYN